MKFLNWFESIKKELQIIINKFYYKDLEDAKFEIIALVEGVTPALGQTIQARTSYMPNEIFWAHRYFLVNILIFSQILSDFLLRFAKTAGSLNSDGSVIIDYSNLNQTIKTSCPSFSAKMLNRITVKT